MSKYITIHQTVKGNDGCENVTYRERRLHRVDDQRTGARERARREWETQGYVVLTQWDGI